MNEKRAALRTHLKAGPAEAVLERLRIATEATNDSQLAKKLGISQTTVSTWRTRGIIPYEACAKVAVETGTSIDVLLLGEKLPVYRDASPIYKPLFDLCLKLASAVEKMDVDAAIALAVQMYNDRVELLSGLLSGSLSIEMLTRNLEASDRATIAALASKNAHEAK